MTSACFLLIHCRLAECLFKFLQEDFILFFFFFDLLTRLPLLCLLFLSSPTLPPVLDTGTEGIVPPSPPQMMHRCREPSVPAKGLGQLAHLMLWPPGAPDCPGSQKPRTEVKHTVYDNFMSWVGEDLAWSLCLFLIQVIALKSQNPFHLVPVKLQLNLSFPCQEKVWQQETENWPWLMFYLKRVHTIHLSFFFILFQTTPVICNIRTSLYWTCICTFTAFI